ncbi:MAG: Efflux transporter periplasmic adaptor subunit [Spartobacteria bacterium]|nr:Efflux transporter periplasmic adaptor subunit [Spartobacteria bacterium]
MHDIAQPAVSRQQMKSVAKKTLSAVGAILLLVALVVGLKGVGVAVLTIAVIVFTVVAVVSAILSYRRFRGERTTSGASWAVVFVLCLLLDMKASQFRKMTATPFAMPATAVSSAPVKEEDWAPTLPAVGSISAVQGAMVAAELSGVVSQVEFQNGGVAKKGDVLVRLETSSEGAQLRTAEADLELARANRDRARDLVARKVISKSELDSAESGFGQKQGIVDNMRSMIGKKEVHAPFDGQLGIRQVNVGQMINAGQQVVALTALDPVFVDFALPQQELSKLSDGLEVQVQTDAVPGRQFKGKLTAINSMVDAITRNVSLQATLDNHDHALRPGMFAKAEIILPEKQKTLVVPGSAVSYAPYGDSVYVIEKKKDPKTGKESQTIRQQVVRVGEARGDFVAIIKGLQKDQTVVSSGVFKLRNGMAVTINNDLAPKPQINPTPEDS